MYKTTKRVKSAAPVQYKFHIDNFYGTDLTNDKSNVGLNYSPDCLNMIRDTLGKPRKRMGYRLLDTQANGDKVNGFHVLEVSGASYNIIHIGTKIYLWDNATNKIGTLLYSSANNKRSKALQIESKLYIFDGLKLLRFDGTNIVTVESIAYVPTVLIAKNPSGGGTLYEPFNLLQSQWIETFCGTETDTEYYLSKQNLESIEIVEVLNSNGEWEEVTTGITKDLINGKVTFTTAPGESPAAPEPNVRIKSKKAITGYADKINKCDICTLYGVNGAYDRIFCSGNPDYPNYDWYCELNNPTYWGDTWYSVLGQDNAPIMGYSIINNYLATHKNNEENNANIFLRDGRMDSNGNALFPVVDNYQGVGSICKNSQLTYGNEPMYLTSYGLYAVTPNDMVGNKITSPRSEKINGKLLTENNLSDALAIVFKEFYMLFINSHVYILDFTHYSMSEIFSRRQYDCYYWENVPANSVWINDDKLYFGTPDGKIFEFYNDKNVAESYNDNGVAISARWKTPLFYGNEFFNKKNFNYLSVLLGTSSKASCKAYAYYENEKETLINAHGEITYFDYAYINYNAFTYSVDLYPQILSEKIKINKVNKVQFEFSNSVLNEPFRIFEFTAIYTESR